MSEVRERKRIFAYLGIWSQHVDGNREKNCWRRQLRASRVDRHRARYGEILPEKQRAGAMLV